MKQGAEGFNPEVQDEFVSTNRISLWGEISAKRAVIWAKILMGAGELCDDDLCVDFGGNDGFVSESWGEVTHRPMTVLDPLETRVKVAEARGLPVIRATLEDIPLLDGAASWGFCSHTLEHTFDLDRAFSELSRVVSQGLFVVIPLETDRAREKNPSHNWNNPNPTWWLNKARSAGFHIWRFDTNWDEDLEGGEVLAILLKPEAELRWSIKVKRVQNLGSEASEPIHRAYRIQAAQEGAGTP